MRGKRIWGSIIVVGSAACLGAIGGRHFPTAQSTTEPRDQAHRNHETLSELLSETAQLPTAPLLPEQTAQGQPPPTDDRPDIAYFPAVIAASATPAANHLGSEQQAIWQKELANLPPEQAHEIQQLRTKLGSIAAQSLGLTALEPSVPEPSHINIPQDGSLKSVEKRSTFTLADAEHAIRQVSSENRPEHQRLNQVLAVHRHNLAFQSVAGFRRSEIVLSQTHGPIEQRVDLRAGTVTKTENPLDVAIIGTGWFLVGSNTADTQFVTRCGLLTINSDRKLAVRMPQRAMPLIPEIVVPSGAQRVEILANGICHVWLSDSSEPQVCGHLKLANCVDASQLHPTDDGLHTANGRSGALWLANPGERGLGTLQSGFLEGSNVDKEQESEQAQRLLETISVANSRHTEPE